MKKVIYSFIFAVVAAVSISACTEDHIKPKDGEGFGSPGCQPGFCPPKAGA